MEGKTIYFEQVSPANTEATFRAVEQRLRAKDIKKLVVASTTGATAKKAMDLFRAEGIQLVVVPHQFGFREKNAFPQELVKSLREAGHEVHFGTMLFHTESLYESNAPALMANLLRCFGQGVKVCFEIVLMATDAGLCTLGEKVIAIAGTAKGCDTALVMQAASSHDLKKLRVNEILCKQLNPWNIDELREKMAREKEVAGPERRAEKPEVPKPTRDWRKNLKS